MCVCMRVLVHYMILGPSVRARRDRQDLTKNKPQLDDELSRDGDMHAQDLEPSAESLPSHKDTPVNSSTSIDRKRKRSDVLVAASSEACHTQSVEDDVCNVTTTKTLGTSATVRREDSKKFHLPSVPASGEPLPKKSCSQAAERKSTNSSSLSSSKELSHHRAVNGQSVSRQLITEGKYREVTHDSTLRSNIDDEVGKTVSYLCEAELKTVRNNGCNAIVDSSNATVGASESDLKTAKSTAASRIQSVSLTVDRQATGNSVTLGSGIDATMHQTGSSDTKMLQPNIVKQQQSGVRFEGNH